ncbi:polyprenyl synthetase [Limosilactobacillus coleohominis DSM 14060]|nr:polyprenyl synthetase [Limosilactobacillus coleohominis DSM 14060]
MATVTRLSLVRELATAAGPAGMVAGQAMDIHNEGHHLALPDLQLLHEKKTGALIRYAVLAGGIITNQAPGTKHLLARFGEYYGLAFQIYDDLMDVVGSEERMGKAVRKDQVEAKNTYPGLLGLAETKHQLAIALAKARKLEEELNQQTNGDFTVLEEFLAYFK